MQQEDGDDSSSDADPAASEHISAREGDVLVVSYPETKIPIGRYSSTTVGGLIYTRRLLPSDDVQAEFNRLYRFLRRNAEREAREKVKLWVAELRAKHEPESLRDVAPKPAVEAREVRAPASVVPPTESVVPVMSVQPGVQSRPSARVPKPVLPGRSR